MAINDPAIEALRRIYLDLGIRLHEAYIEALINGYNERTRARDLLAQVDAELRRLGTTVDTWERGQVQLSFDLGRQDAEAKLSALYGRPYSTPEASAFNRLNRPAIEAIAQDIAGQRGRFLGSILRQGQDLLREISSGEIARGLGLGNGARVVGEAIREGAIARVLEQRGGAAKVDALAKRIDAACGVVYSDGSVHSLEAYGQMSARTGMMRAFAEGSARTYQAAGVHLYTVSTNGTLCHICLPYEGKTFAFDEEGERLGYPRMNRPVPLHPNCQHSIAPALEELGPYEQVDPAVLTATDSDLYARMRDEVPDGRQRLDWARRGFRNDMEAKRLEARGQEYGPRYRRAGIEARRIEATRRVLESGGKVSYRQALRDVLAEAS